MKKLYRFFGDCGRTGYIDGLFIAEEAKVKRAIGEEIDFGEVLGKHSQIVGVLKEGDVVELSDDQNLVKVLLKIFPDGDLAGHNPISELELKDWWQEEFMVGGEPE